MKEAIKGNAPPFSAKRMVKEYVNRFHQPALKSAAKARPLGLFPHPEVLDELLDLDPEIDAFDIVHAVVRVLFLQMSG